MRIPDRRDDGGAVAVLVAVMLAAVLVPLAAIVVDLGFARDLRSQAQTAADAAALAVAVDMKDGSRDPGKAATVAQAYIEQNFPAVMPALAGCGDCVVVDPGARTVTVSLPPVSSPGLFSAGSTGVSASAQASWAPLTGCGLCVSGDLTIGHPSPTGHGVIPGLIKVHGGNVAVAHRVNAGTLVGLAGAIRTPDGLTLYGDSPYPGDQITTEPDAVQQPSTVGHPKPVTGTLAALGDDPSIQRVTFDRDDHCTPPPGHLAAYFDPAPPSESFPSGPQLCTGGFAPGIYVLIGTPSASPTTRINSSTDTAAPGPVSGALFYLTCGADGRPADCGGPGVTSRAALRGSEAGGVVVHGLSGDSGHPELDGYALVVDPALTDQQVIGGLTIKGDVYVPSASVGSLTVKGRLTAGTLVTGTGATSLDLTVDASDDDGPVRLVR